MNNFEEAYNYVNEAYLEYTQYYGNETSNDCKRCIDLIS